MARGRCCWTITSSGDESRVRRAVRRVRRGRRARAESDARALRAPPRPRFLPPHLLLTARAGRSGGLRPDYGPSYYTAYGHAPQSGAASSARSPLARGAPPYLDRGLPRAPHTCARTRLCFVRLCFVLVSRFAFFSVRPCTCVGRGTAHTPRAVSLRSLLGCAPICDYSLQKRGL